MAHGLNQPFERVLALACLLLEESKGWHSIDKDRASLKSKGEIEKITVVLLVAPCAIYLITVENVIAIAKPEATLGTGDSFAVAGGS